MTEYVEYKYESKYGSKYDGYYAVNKAPELKELTLTFKKISIGTGPDKQTFDLIKIFKGLELLADSKKDLDK